MNDLTRLAFEDELQKIAAEYYKQASIPFLSSGINLARKGVSGALMRAGKVIAPKTMPAAISRAGGATVAKAVPQVSRTAETAVARAVRAKPPPVSWSMGAQELKAAPAAQRQFSAMRSGVPQAAARGQGAGVGARGEMLARRAAEETPEALAAKKRALKVFAERGVKVPQERLMEFRRPLSRAPTRGATPAQVSSVGTSGFRYSPEYLSKLHPTKGVKMPSGGVSVPVAEPMRGGTNILR